MTMTAEQLEELLGKVTPDWCVYSEPEVGLEPSLFAGRVGEVGFGPIEPLQGYDLMLASIAPSLARRVLAAEKLVEALKGMIEAYREPDKQLCCNEYMCGCRGASERDYADYWAAEAIKAWEDAE